MDAKSIASEPVDWNKYKDQSPISLLFRSQAQTEIIGVFVQNQTSEMNVSEIADKSNVTRKTVYESLPILQNFGVINQTKMHGNSPLYQLNRDSPISHLCIQIDSLAIQKLYQKRNEMNNSEIVEPDFSVQ